MNHRKQFRTGITRRQFLRRTVWGAAACCAPPVTAALLRAAESGGEVPWLDEVQTPPKAIPADAPRLRPLLINDDGGAITTVEGWQRRRKKLQQWWLDYLQAIKVEPKYKPALTVLEEDRQEGVIRQRVRYEPEPGEPTEAYLLKPSVTSGRRPGVLVFHSTLAHTILQPAGLGPKDRVEEVFGLGLARRGYVALCPRNYLWVENTKESANEAVSRFRGRHPQSKGMAKMLLDAIVGVNILAGLPEVDPGRLGTIGHSLGGKEVLYLAAFDERVRTVVSSEGGIGIGFSNWNAPWYLGQDVRRSDFMHDHHELLAMIAPRAFLLLGGDNTDGARSWPFIEAALPVYRLYGGKPRVGLFNHGKGHHVPPDAENRAYQWLDTYC